MDNNILQMLSGMLNKNSTNASPKNDFSQNFSNKSAEPPLYPVEAYSVNQQTQNMQNASPSESSNNSQNNMLPLLLSLMGQNGNNDMFSKLLQNQSGNNDLSSLASLFSSLNKKKNDNKKEEPQSSSIQASQGEIPSDDIL